MPVVDTLAIFFVEPLLLTLLSPIFLDEKIGIRRILAVMIGFVGALIIIQPSAKAFGIYAVLPLGAAFCFALYLVITSKLAQHTNPVIIQLYTGFAALLTISAALLIGNAAGFVILQITIPTPEQWAWMILIGAIACVGHLLLVYAFSFADASALAPFHYFEIVGAVFFGWYFFTDIPAFSTWVGITIIFSSGFYVYHREKLLS